MPQSGSGAVNCPIQRNGWTLTEDIGAKVRVLNECQASHKEHTLPLIGLDHETLALCEDEPVLNEFSNEPEIQT
jgi:hypothetical protein